MKKLLCLSFFPHSCSYLIWVSWVFLCLYLLGKKHENLMSKKDLGATIEIFLDIMKLKKKLRKSNATSMYMLHCWNIKFLVKLSVYVTKITLKKQIKRKKQKQRLACSLYNCSSLFLLLVSSFSQEVTISFVKFLRILHYEYDFALWIDGFSCITNC